MKDLKILQRYRLLAFVWAGFVVGTTLVGIGTWLGTISNLIVIAVAIFTINTAIREEKKKVGKYIYHRNEWWWGKSVTVITHNASGTCAISIDNKYADWGMIHSLMVIERERRSGLGTALIKECENEGRKLGLTQFYLEARKDNEWLVKWYQRMGYEISTEDCGAAYKMYKEVKGE